MAIRIVVILLVFSSLCFAELTPIERDYIPSHPKISTTDDLQVTPLGNGLTPEDMVDFLVGHNTGNVDIDNIHYNGASNASGIFTGASVEGLPIESGVILSSGDAENIYGPNQSNGITGNNFLPGTTLLDSLIPGYTTYDASVLEFDCTPKYNSIGFTYVFGSDEYLEYVGTSYNDVFGLFIDGQNIALIPGTDVAVSINNVNNQSYSQFYIDNPTGMGYFNVEADGFTTAISVRAIVQPDISHHIAFAVADAGDHILDSWVFLEQGSFHSEPCTAFFDVIIVEGTELSMLEDEEMEIHAIAIGEDTANFVWTLHQPQHGTIQFINSDLIEEERTILYTPDQHYNGLDYFIISVQDGLGGIINRYIEVELAPVRDRPVCTEPPYIYGNFMLGQQAFCYAGQWNDFIDNQYAEPGQYSQIFISYQWQISETGIGFWNDIADADQSNIIIPQDALNKFIRCLVIATDTGIGVGPDDTAVEITNIEFCGLQTNSNNNTIDQTQLLGAYPNPSNPTTTISFQLVNDSNVELKIYNTKGQMIKSLVNSSKSAGRYQITWNGEDEKDRKCSSGMYLIKLQTNEEQFVQKLLLLK